VAPRLDFLTKKSNAPSIPCSQGLHKIIKSSPKKEEKNAACKCLKDAASQIPNLDKDRANNLSKTCKTHDDSPSNDLDCEK